MVVLPLAAPGRWIHDTRGPERALRVSPHASAGYLVISTWRDGECVGTVRVTPAEAADLMAGLAMGMAELAAPGPDEHAPPIPPSPAAPVPPTQGLRSV